MPNNSSAPAVKTKVASVNGVLLGLTVTAEAVSATLGGSSGAAPGKIVHYLTGDVLAYRHTAHVIGGVDGEIIPLLESNLCAA